MSLLSFASRVRSRVWVGYLLAVVVSAAALLVRLQLGDTLAGYPFLTFFAAVLLVAFLGGKYPALLTVAITALMADYFLLSPSGSLTLDNLSSLWALAIYVAITGTLIMIIDTLTRTQDGQADIDELRRQQALFESEQKFSILVQGVRDYAIYMLDPTGRVSNWNSGAALIKGYSADEIVGQHFSRFYTDADRTRGEPQRALEVALSEGKYEREAHRVRKDGSLFWASVVIDPIFDGDGKHIGFAKITRDISERKERELELEQARETIAQAQKLQTLGEFTGGIAHDFNNLLTVIVGASDFLLKHPDLAPAKTRKYLESIAHTADRAATLTNHLLAFARRQSLRPEVVDLGVRLDAFGEMIGRLLGSMITVKVEGRADRALVEVDAAQLDTALLNAAVNARDAMPDGGQLRLETSDCELEGKPAICITMTDTGIGIPPDDLTRVFEPFFTTKETGKGTGLGLSQLHGFAAQAGGEAEIESEVGRGTTLRIRLPRTTKSPVTTAPSHPLAKLPPNLCFLVVEDNGDVRQFATKILEDMGCKVVAAEDGVEALEKLRTKRFDLVFSDVMMPNMTGLDLAGVMRRDHADTPLILTTGYSEELIGAVPEDTTIVRKPYDVTTLQQALIAALGIAPD